MNDTSTLGPSEAPAHLRIIVLAEILSQELHLIAAEKMSDNERLTAMRAAVGVLDIVREVLPPAKKM